MNYLLDACVLSEFIKSEPNEQVVAWVNRTPEEKCFLSTLTIGEIKSGISRLPESKRRIKLEQWFEDVIENFDDRILPVSFQIAAHWGVLKGERERMGRLASVIDSLLAATAHIHHLTVVTRNTKDFEYLGVGLFNPWDQQNDSH